MWRNEQQPTKYGRILIFDPNGYLPTWRREHEFTMLNAFILMRLRLCMLRIIWDCSKIRLPNDNGHCNAYGISHFQGETLVSMKHFEVKHRFCKHSMRWKPFFSFALNVCIFAILNLFTTISVNICRNSNQYASKLPLFIYEKLTVTGLLCIMHAMPDRDDDLLCECWSCVFPAKSQNQPKLTVDRLCTAHTAHIGVDDMCV